MKNSRMGRSIPVGLIFLILFGCENTPPLLSNTLSTNQVIEFKHYPALNEADRNSDPVLVQRYVAGRLIVKLKEGVTQLPQIQPDRNGAMNAEALRMSQFNTSLAQAKPLSGRLHTVDLPILADVLPIETRSAQPSSAPKLSSQPIPTQRTVVQQKLFLDNRTNALRMKSTTRGDEIRKQVRDMDELETYLRSPRFANSIEFVAREQIHFPVHETIPSNGQVSNDTYAGYQWHYGPAREGGAGFTEYWQAYGAGRAEDEKQIVVAVIDSGQIFNHPDIDRNNILPGYDFINDSANGDGDGRDNDPTDPGDGRAANYCPYSPQPSEDSWHGTHVSATIGSAKSNNGFGVASGAWGVKILPIRALGKCGGSSLDIAEAIDWAVLKENDPLLPPKPERPADIINLSLGGISSTCDPVYQSAIDRARAAGAIVVVAAGNSAIDAKFFTPANCDGVITVAASDTRSILSPYSNYGENIDIMAPGGDTSIDRNGDGFRDGVLSIVKDTYKFYQGTSMAAPHVAAAAALVWSANPQMSAFQVENFLKYRGRPIQPGACRSLERCGRSHLDLSAGLER